MKLNLFIIRQIRRLQNKIGKNLRLIDLLSIDGKQERAKPQWTLWKMSAQ